MTSAGSAGVTCPRCGFEQPGGEECGRCGVVFRKAKTRAAAGTPRAPGGMPIAVGRPAASSRRRAALVVATVGVAIAAFYWLSRGRNPDDHRGSSPTGPERSVEASGPGQGEPGPRRRALRLLRERHFSELEAALRAAESNTARDIRHEDELFLSYRAFYVADPTVGRLVEEWLRRDPDAAMPRVARAKHFEAVGWRRRGTRWAGDTTPRAFAEMAAFHEQGRIDARAAVRQEPRLLEAHVILIDLATARGDQPDCRLLAADGLRLWPASWRLRAALLNCLKPRWGGSWEEMERVAREAQAQAGGNPRLATLLGVVAYDRAEYLVSDKRYAEAIQLYDQALAHGDAWQFLEGRADARGRLDDATGALSDLERALTLLPEEPDLLVERAAQLVALGRTAEAHADLLLAEDLDPTQERLARRRRELGQKERELGYAAYTSRDFARAIQHFDRALSLDADSADTLYRRALARRKNGDPRGALEDLREAWRLEPSFGTARELDDLLARQEAWKEVLAVWDQFIAANPGHADAHLERAGSHRHAGHPEQAAADLRRACELGSARACAILQR